MEDRLAAMYAKVGRDRDNAPRPIAEDTNGRKVFPARPVVHGPSGDSYWISRACCGAEFRVKPE